MLEVAVVGGGLSGLALARSLHRRDRSFSVFEARDRLGGRVLSVKQGEGGIDLGPTWFWPETQPAVARLIRELGLAELEQFDEGAALHLREADKSATRIEDKRSSRRRATHPGRYGDFIESLAKELPQKDIHLRHELASLRDCGDHVLLTFRVGEQMVEVSARHVVLALPPRLLKENVEFAPSLDEATEKAMDGAETWMAAEAKVVIAYREAFWRDAGLSGSAFATHEQSVVGEMVFDACDISSNCSLWAASSRLVRNCASYSASVCRCS